MSDRIVGGRLARTAKLARLGARIGGSYVSSAARKTFADAERRIEIDQQRQLTSAEAVAAELGQMKGAMMKLGQMASYLDDGLPEPFRVALSQLQSGAPPMSGELAASVVRSELGAGPEDVFIEWDPEPIAAASIGQVHRAIAADSETGEHRPVAVKVQYPGVDAAIEADLANADLIGAMLRQSFGGLDPEDLVSELRERLIDELDYRLEAQNQQLFADFYRDHPFVRIPEVLHEYSARRVFTSELVNGSTWSEMCQWSPEARNRSGEAIFRFVFRSLYVLQAFNGDPHPGNYLFHEDGTVTFLDFGLVKRFTDAEMATFATMVQSVAVDHDLETFRRTIERAGMLLPDAPVSTEAVGDYFSKFYEPVRYDREMTWTPDYASSIVRHVFDRDSPIAQYATVPRPFVFIQRINLGLYALLGELGATANWRRISAEIWPFIEGAPSTELGRQESEWLATRPPNWPDAAIDR